MFFFPYRYLHMFTLVLPKSHFGQSMYVSLCTYIFTQLNLYVQISTINVGMRRRCLGSNIDTLILHVDVTGHYFSKNYTASPSRETLCSQDGLEELGFPQNYRLQPLLYSLDTSVSHRPTCSSLEAFYEKSHSGYLFFIPSGAATLESVL